jgi:hypothetical protein
MLLGEGLGEKLFTNLNHRDFCESLKGRELQGGRFISETGHVIYGLQKGSASKNAAKSFLFTVQIYAPSVRRFDQ